MGPTAPPYSSVRAWVCWLWKVLEDDSLFGSGGEMFGIPDGGPRLVKVDGRSLESGMLSLWQLLWKLEVVTLHRVEVALELERLPELFEDWLAELALELERRSCRSLILEDYHKETKGMVRWERPAVLKSGMRVTVKGLSKAADLNGMSGMVCGPRHDGRYPVCIEGVGGKRIRRENLVMEVKATHGVRLPAKGESTPPKVVPVPDVAVYYTSPIFTLLGDAIGLVRVPFEDDWDGNYVNQPATLFMAEVDTGLAPQEWQACVGPVVVFRLSGGALTVQEVMLMNDFLHILMDEYPDPDNHPRGPVLTPARWASFLGHALRT
eukprot:Sspe_Gene.114067::Locus_99171_Transcript_1_1_Confidence_1.000_Length_1108::g.114067::m.114067